jgi:hypothetical protein
MKALFLLLELLTDSDAVRNFLHSCFTVAVFSVGVLFLLVTYQVFRRSYGRRTGPAQSRA